MARMYLRKTLSGFVPADKPRYAFSVVYEGDAGQIGDHGGTVAAPMIAKVMRELFKDEKPQKKHKHDDDSDDDDSDAQVHHARSHDTDNPPPPPPRKPPAVPFWKRWFQ